MRAVIDAFHHGRIDIRSDNCKLFRQNETFDILVGLVFNAIHD